MTGRRRRPSWHADPTAVRRVVVGTVFTTLDVDWLGVDATGKVAVFLGELDASPVPSLASPKDTSLALEAVAATLATRTDARKEEAYRVASARPGEPIFDVPTAGGAPLHERPFDGYPHLFVATDEGAAQIRELESSTGGGRSQAAPRSRSRSPTSARTSTTRSTTKARAPAAARSRTPTIRGHVQPRRSRSLASMSMPSAQTSTACRSGYGWRAPPIPRTGKSSRIWRGTRQRSSRSTSASRTWSPS